jgi:hypothetical protein
MHTIERKDGNVVEVALSGKATAADYEDFVPQVEAEISRRGPLRVLWDMSRLESVEPGALWRDLRFDIEHRADWERVAIVGDKRWHDWAAQLFKPFVRNAPVRYFDEDQRDEAENWLAEGLAEVA